MICVDDILFDSVEFENEFSLLLLLLFVAFGGNGRMFPSELDINGSLFGTDGVEVGSIFDGITNRLLKAAYRSFDVLLASL